MFQSRVIDHGKPPPYTRATTLSSGFYSLRHSFSRRHILGGTVLEPLEVAQFIVDVASDKMAEDIVLLDLRELAPFADYFVIMSAESSRQIEALEEDLTQSLKDAGIVRHHREGTPCVGLGVAGLQRCHRPCLFTGGARVLRSGTPLAPRPPGGSPCCNLAVVPGVHVRNPLVLSFSKD